MAAPMSENEHLPFQSIACQFFEMIPLRRLQWQCKNVSMEDLGVEKQKKLLALTVNSDLCKRYPPSVQHQRSFVKKLLTKLEEYGAEVCDEVYETYTHLLQQRDSEEDSLCYKTYTLSPNERITIQESVNMISFGTTGLSTWQAAQHLAEWLLQNNQIVEGRNVLELGSGLGMMGLVVCKKCHIKSYTFTDCHTHVLKLLASNIHINICDKEHNDTVTVPTHRVKRARLSESDEDIHQKTENICTCSELSHEKHTEKQTEQEATPTQEIKVLKQSNSAESDVCEYCAKTSSADDKSLELTSTSTSRPELQSRCTRMSVDYECDETGLDRGPIYPDDLELSKAIWNQTSDNRYTYRSRSEISVCRLDWEHITQTTYTGFEQTSVILAADVVYDVRIIPSLVSVLKAFLARPGTGEGDTPCVAYIASTIRNEDTRDQFLIALSSDGLRYEAVDPPTTRVFHYDTSVPIEIIKVTAAATRAGPRSP